ncbi:AMP-binding protein [Rapidithrix thailandica]|uniref:Long-chain-fatty-acid--CoA ligase n=2 Tax=Rapidithrix thailandica TaxID=413964 RepID=A0AAW9S784_9BACT
MEVQSNSQKKHYPEGIPHEINAHQYESLVDLIEQAFQDYGPLPAFDCMGTSISYKALDQLSQNFATYLQQDLGLKAGTRIAIQMPNVLQYPIAMLGALRAGLIVVNTNPLYTAREMKHQFVDSGVEAIVILANFAYNLEKIVTETSIKHIVITEIGDQLGGLKKLIVNGVVKYIKKMVPAYRLPSAVSFREALKRGSRKRFQRVAVKGQDTAFLQYTGGTTGVSKGAELSHTNLVANVEQLSTWLSVRLIKGEEIVITPLPLYHIYALSVSCFTVIKLGARNVLITNPRDIKGFIKELEKYPFSVMAGINTLYNSMMNHPNFDRVDFSHLKVACAGGMALQMDVAKRWKNKTGVPIAEGYGLTETSPVLTSNIPLTGQERIGTVGLPIPSTQIMIANDEGEEVPAEIPGEIYVKGPQVMKGYWNRPEETEKVFTKEGWFKTGDIGVMDKDGFLRIVDRKKEMILVSGFNVYPNEIEEVVSGHEKVLEVGAVGVPDDRSIEVVKIFVVKKDPSLTKEELLAYCRENLTAYKVPRHIEFREELPKSNVGKILRRLLKEEPPRST